MCVPLKTFACYLDTLDLSGCELVHYANESSQTDVQCNVMGVSCFFFNEIENLSCCNYSSPSVFEVLH